jgi:hypothetical protein
MEKSQMATLIKADAFIAKLHAQCPQIPTGINFFKQNLPKEKLIQKLLSVLIFLL